MAAKAQTSKTMIAAVKKGGKPPAPPKPFKAASFMKKGKGK